MNGEPMKSQQQNIPNMDPPPYDSQKPPPYPTDEKFGSYPPSWSPYGDNAQQTGNASMPHNPPRPPHMQQPHGHPVAVVFVNSGEPTSFIGEPIVAETFARQMCLACIVMWCCNCLFGLMAYILATMAQNLSLTDRGRARRLGELSLKVSLVGIIVTVVAALILGGVCRGTHRCWDRSYPTTSNCSGYEIEGLCYSHRRSVFMLPNCQKSFDTCCHPSEDMYYRQYCYTLMNFDQQDFDLNVARAAETTTVAD